MVLGGITPKQRVGEVAALRFCDVLDIDGRILAETALGAEQTKGDKSRFFGLMSECVLS